MRVALIALHFSEYAYRLAGALAAEHDVLLIVERHGFNAELGTDKPRNQSHRLRICFIEHRRSLMAVFSNAAQIRRAVKEFQPDVVHLQEAIVDYLALAFPFLKRYPILITIHDPELHVGELKFSGLKRRYNVYRWLLRRWSDGAIVHGVFLQAEVERLYPHFRGRVFAIAHGPLGETDIAPSFKWEAGTLLFFGRILAYKGLPYFIATVERLAAEGLKVKGIIAGRGVELDQYRAKILESELLELNETFIAREDLPNLFHRAQIVVLPYTDGTQSGVAGLAMAFARPVIASAVGSIPEMVRHRLNGLLTAPGNVTELVDSLRTLLSDPDYSNDLGRNGWGLGQTELSWPSLGQTTGKAYRAIVEAKTGLT